MGKRAWPRLGDLSRRGFLCLIGGIVATTRMPWPQIAHVPVPRPTGPATIHSGVLVADRYCPTNTMYFFNRAHMIQYSDLVLAQPTPAMPNATMNAMLYADGAGHA